MTDRPVYRPKQDVNYSFWINTAKYDVEGKSQFAGQKFTVKIKSAMGIGRMEIGLKTQDGKWPEAVVLSIQTKDGKPLRELEGFTLSGAKIRIQGSGRTSGKMDCHDVDPNDPKAPNKNLRKVNVTVEKTDKALTVAIPGKVLQGERKVTIQWIDYYR